MIPTPDRPLTDGRVALRLCAERDIPEILIAYEDDRHLHERLGEARPPSGADLGRASEEAAHKLEAGVRAQLTITEASSDVCVGIVTISDLDWEHARGEIQVWVAPARRGRGYARAALRLAAGWAFEVWGIARLAALVEPDNVMMQRAAAAAGFRHEGTFAAYRTAGRGGRGGRRVDLDVLSLIPADLEESGGQT
jgi:ribosomal-protein-alanine N-acetyltransferase